MKLLLIYNLTKSGFFENDSFLITFGYFIITCIIVGLLSIISYLCSPFVLTSEKSSSYECGFDPFGNTRSTIYVRFYLIGILYLIFDIEVILLYPWIFPLYNQNLNLLNFSMVLVFLLILGIGFIYEWTHGVLTTS